jgi:outer membrane protein OmpA-like peptidoglycan-associated protein
MDAADEPTGNEPSAPGAFVVDKHRAPRRVGRMFWTAAVTAPVLLTALIGYTQGPVLEQSLREEAQTTLTAEGLKGVRVVMDGRGVTAKVPTGKNPKAVEKVLTRVDGVSTVSTVAVYASAAEARACKDLQKKVDRATGGQRITFAGASTQLTAEGRQRVLATAGLLRACPTAVATIGGHTDSHILDGANISFERARVIMRLLKEQRISSTRLLPRGYADQFPISQGDSLAAQARNHRGSIAVTGQ